MHFDAQVGVVGCLGALLLEAARWVALRNARRLPAYTRKLHYWLLSLLLVLLGGVLVAVLGASTTQQALAMGMAAPALISRMATLPAAKPQLGPSETPLREWFRG